MREEFDVVVVGSGFGGSVMAYELACAGRRVCVLERGRRYPPGSFARSPHAMRANFWDPSEGLYGLFDVWSFRHSEAFVSSGLGGGSLIYANVLLRKPEEWFFEIDGAGRKQPWVVSRAELEPHYDVVEAVLGASEYPFATSAFEAPKALAFRKAAEQLGRQDGRTSWEAVKLAVAFASDANSPPMPAAPIHEAHPNLHGRPRRTCRLCGECDIGCNDGSKNSLDFNYLSLAARAGAEIRDLCEVKALRPHSRGGYEVDYVRHLPDGAGAERRVRPAVVTIAAARVVIAAGALGSTYLLLKCREQLRELSPALGTRYSTNGDLLSFAIRCRDRGVDPPRAARIDASRGPVITGTIRHDIDPHRGFYLQDAGYPEFLNWLLEASNAPGWISRGVSFAWRRLRAWLSDAPDTEIDAELSRLLGSAELSSSSMPLLGMGRDRPSGRMSLRAAAGRAEPYLQVDWHRRDSADYFDALVAFSHRVAEAMGGAFRENPTSRHLRRIAGSSPSTRSAAARWANAGRTASSIATERCSATPASMSPTVP
jgi:cholesterol oxidase